MRGLTCTRGIMKITRSQLRQIIRETIGKVYVQTRLRGQNDRDAFASGVFENEIQGVITRVHGKGPPDPVDLDSDDLVLDNDTDDVKR